MKNITIETSKGPWIVTIGKGPQYGFNGWESWQGDWEDAGGFHRLHHWMKNRLIQMIRKEIEERG
jgi:hypothetical protein